MQKFWLGSVLSAICLTTFTSSAQHVSKLSLFQSTHSDFNSQVCLGHITEDTQGKPASIYNLGFINSTYCRQNYVDFQNSEFTALMAQADLDLNDVSTFEDRFIESIEHSELAERIYSPIPISQTQLDQEQVYVLGVGLNFMEHRLETGMSPDTSDWENLLFFPKAVVPSSPYGTVEKGLKLGSKDANDVILLDYEVELGVLVLEDLHLDALPGDIELYQKFAYFVANDVSDREPIVLDTDAGYTQAKTHPGYMPIGPWVVFSNDIPNLFVQPEEFPLTMQLKVQSQNSIALRQDGNTRQMIWEPAQILNVLSNYYARGERLCMRDTTGVKRYLYSENGVIPAGSIMLTGTPGGTAIKQPEWFDKVSLFLQGGFSISGAREAYIENLEADHEALGFLKHDDVMITSISQLGTQEHVIKRNEKRESYGKLLVNANCSYIL